MIYQATHHINFAQGEMATFSTFIAWALIQKPAVPYWAPSSDGGISFAGGLLPSSASSCGRSRRRRC
jgi:branched-chain amino acid transport system permease protein